MGLFGRLSCWVRSGLRHFGAFWRQGSPSRLTRMPLSRRSVHQICRRTRAMAERSTDGDERPLDPREERKRRDRERKREFRKRTCPEIHVL